MEQYKRIVEALCVKPFVPVAFILGRKIQPTHLSTRALLACLINAETEPRGQRFNFVRTIG